MKPRFVLLLLAVLALAGCSAPGLTTSHAALWFTPEQRTAAVELQAAGGEAVRVESVRVEGRDWDRFTIRSQTVTGVLEPLESLRITVEAEPRATHTEGYSEYAASEGYLLIGHDDTFTKVELHIQPRPSPRDGLVRLAVWAGTIALTLVGLVLGGGRPRERWFALDGRSRGAWVALAASVGLGAGRFGLCTSWSQTLQIGDVRQCANGLGGAPMTLLPPAMACALGVLAVLWIAVATRRKTELFSVRLAASILAFSWIAPPVMLSANLLAQLDASVTQPLLLSIASVMWVVGIAFITRWTTRATTRN